MEIKLTRAQLEIIKLLAQGLSNKEIAKEYRRDRRTVEFHINKIYDKVGLRRRIKLVNWWNSVKHDYET